MERKTGPTDKRRFQRARDLRLSDPERHLLRKLTNETRSKNTTIGVVLSPEEMDFLRRLSGIRAPARNRKRRTSDLVISSQEKSLLEALALGEAVDAAEAPQTKPRKRTTEIVLSPEEAALLNRLSGQEETSQPGSAVREKLRGGELGAGPGGSVVLELTGTEVRWLNELTSTEAPLTEGERSARVQLLDKISRANTGD